jgi:hypothetical protein
MPNLTDQFQPLFRSKISESPKEKFAREAHRNSSVAFAFSASTIEISSGTLDLPKFVAEYPGIGLELNGSFRDVISI